MRVTVAAWIGSANAGDNLIFAALSRKLLARGTHVTAISLPGALRARDPGNPTPAPGTTDAQLRTIDHRDVGRIVGAIRNSDALIVGGGGLLQDQTSSFNLPYHLSRIAVARAVGTSFAAVGIGAGPLRTTAGRWQVRHALRGAAGIGARDHRSRALLRSLGIPGVRLSADLALSLPAPSVTPVDVICACLRPWRATRGRLPVRTRAKTDLTAESMVKRLAAGLDEASNRTDLPVRLVALQPGWDDLLHRRVAERMSCPVELAPSTSRPERVLAQIAASRVVVAMRYHAGIGAVLAGRPAVLIGYDPKLEGLSAALGAAGRLLPWDADALTELGAAVETVMPHADLVPTALSALRTREAVNDQIIDTLLARAKVQP